MFETSRIELSASAYKQNISFLKRLTGKSQICSVVKGNAYGHGTPEITKLAQQNGIKIFAVFNAQEAYDIAPHLEKDCRLIIMGEIDRPEMEWTVSNGVEFFAYDLHILEQAMLTSFKVGKPARAHIELETGMNRLGIEKGHQQKMTELICDNLDYFKPMGVCTHLCGAESIANFDRIRTQIKNFETYTPKIIEQLKMPLPKHAACSAAVIRFPETCYDMVRAGIIQYGLWPSIETRIDYSVKKQTERNPLKRVISWRSHVMSFKRVAKGQFIGYGTSYQAGDDKRIGIVPVGYSNGFSRSLSNQGVVIIRGRRVPVIGMVNMNAFSIDLSHSPEVQIGDPVTLIGKDSNKEISISSFSEYSSQLNYELLTRLPQHIPRYIV